MMLTLDTNNILSIADSASMDHASQGKQFTRLFHGYPLTAFDHTVLVFTKKGLVQKQWKDIGSSESIIMSIKPFAYEDKPHPGHSRLGYDLLYKVDEASGELKNIARVDTTILSVAQHFFGKSMSALAAPSYDSSMQTNTIISFVFGIALAHGKWPLKDGVLQPIKITLPLTSSLFGKKEIVESLVKNLHEMHIVHSIQYVQGANYEIAQLVLHDPIVLGQFATWLKPVVNIEQISTHEKRKKVYEALLAYTKEHTLKLPIAGAEDMLILEVD